MSACINVHSLFGLQVKYGDCVKHKQLSIIYFDTLCTGCFKCACVPSSVTLSCPSPCPVTVQGIRQWRLVAPAHANAAAAGS